MTEPTTTNVGLIIPNTGDLVGTWGSNALNPDLAAVDGYLGGVQTISLSNVPVTLTSPSFTPTPSSGPTQAQNAVLRFTGVLNANVQVTLPLPGYYIIDNQTTNPNFIVQIKGAGTGQVISIDQGEVQHICNDGTNVKFVNLSRIGTVEIWGGLAALPNWVFGCTVHPYLVCDGGVYNSSDFPYLFAKLRGNFGGNGSTTFAVPDLRGRIPLPYDGTGTRITSAVSGINGAQIGATGGDQNPQQHAHPFSGVTGTMNQNTTHTHSSDAQQDNIASSTGGGSAGKVPSPAGATINPANIDHNHNFAGTTAVSGAGASGNIQPSQVTGIAVIRAA